MLIPSIDLMGNRTVQLVGGKELAIDAGDPAPLAEQFGRVGEVAVIDLDAAMGQGSNRELIKTLLGLARCRVGGGIRDVDSALEWLDKGACKVILGTAARPEILKQLPRERVIAAVDAAHGEVVVEGWKTKTGRSLLDQVRELSGHVGAFLVTFVEREGRLAGIDERQIEELREAAGDARVTVAGGISTAEEIRWLHERGMDAQVGMAIYRGDLGLAEAVAAPLRSDREDGLFATVVCDVSGHALGLAWSNVESLQHALETGRGVYHSRSRGLWVKGATSGAQQDLLSVDLDCDADALRFRVRQRGEGFCHEGTYTCWGEGHGVGELLRRLRTRLDDAPAGSYTRTLLEDETLLAAKLREEVNELVQAKTRDEVTWEAADVLYFTLVRMVGAGVSLEDVERELERRSRVVRRRSAQDEGGSGN